MYCLIAYLEPAMFQESRAFNGVDKVDSIYDLLKLSAAAIVLYVYIRRKKWSLLVIVMSLLQIWTAVATIKNQGDFMRYFGPALTAVVLIMLTEIALDDNVFELISDINKIFTIFFWFNFVYVLAVTASGVDTVSYNYVFFLGIDNRFIFSFLPWVTFNFMLSMYEHGEITAKSIIPLLASWGLLLWRWSVGATFGMTLWFIYIFSTKSGRFKLPSMGAFVSILVSNYALVIDRIQYRFEDIIVGKLHKSITITGRTFLWDAVIAVAQRSPLFGGGVQSIAHDKQYFLVFSGLSACAVPHAHNYFVNITYHGGYVGLGLFIFLFFLSFYKLSRNKEVVYGQTLIYALFIMFILSLVDTLDFPCSYIFFTLAYHIDKLPAPKRMVLKCQ